MRNDTSVDRLFGSLGRSLMTLCAAPAATRRPVGEPERLSQDGSNGASAPSGMASQTAPDDALTESDRRHSAALMRVNHVGEICAQALYEGQALSTSDPKLRHFFLDAAREEADHLAWTKERIDQLGGRVSVLNPFWYAGAYVAGFVAGRFGDPVSLGFMRETERQVEAHLESHVERLPQADRVSRQVIAAMKQDEHRHAEAAADRGASVLPQAVKWMMRASARVMTTTAYRL